ncbi:LuxR C-terminal-related transcriptional regulator [Blastococcus sp. CT_GayMR20]|uniref:LuxR C-terminal-related transcriptional regulator n=1 Tax=Blastococcus sp. CT_GayMR20 TaxID=2559609 RepID=UPI001431A83A|nr:LuxR C-terminal-related transcriptional regulator [Blastococcus sp. CT_GayMR20]
MVVHVPRSRTAVPALPAEFVPRPALLAALDRGLGSTLTLVCAPPGYGKTLLLAEWVRGSDVACAWVSLDQEDDDPRRLWTSVLAGLSVCPAVPPDSRLHGLVVPRTTVGVDFLTEVLDALGELPVPVRLVLDDAHHLRSPEALRGLHLLLRDRLSTVRLVLASRLDPALPLARLRLEERLCELRTAQLSFSLGETVTLADRCGLHLTAEQAGVLHARTDGWAAGIRLAALPLRDHPSPDHFLDAFSGDERPVADYLAGEVFSHISDEDGDLLRRTSISDPIPTALAAELSGRADAADVLDALERSTGLVVASGPHRTEFRFQELMRTYLTADLYRHGPAVAAQLHRQAAAWWAVRRRPVEALRHAAQTGDRPLLTTLLHRWAPELVARGEHTELLRTLRLVEVGDDPIDPWLPLVRAQIHLGNADRVSARVDVERAAGITDASDDEDLAHFRAATARLAGLGGPPADQEATPEETALAALALAGRGVARIFPTAAGGPPGPPSVATDLEKALALARDQHFGLLEVQCLCLIGTAAVVAGDLARAAAAADAAVAAATVHGWHDSPWAAAAHAVQAQASLARAIPGRALQAAVDGLRIAPDGQDAVVRFTLRCARGGALFDLGDRPAGLLELQEAQAELGPTPVPAPVGASAALLEHRAALLLDYPVAAATSLTRLAAHSGHDGELGLMRAWSAAASGSAVTARAAVAPLLDGSVRPSLPSTLVDAWLVEAWAALRLGSRPAARQALQAALAQAEPMDLLRPFAFAGQGLRVLLVDQLGGVRDPDAFAFRCLAARRRVSQSAAPDLSARERDVLTQLVSLSNLGEIADDLAVSVNTVKSHVRAIYGKLGVNTRRTAVLTALERGLLT